MTDNKFIYKDTYELPEQATIKAISPSNIALVKYWGKKPIQIPANPSISFTLDKCHTITEIEFKRSNKQTLRLKVDGKENTSFLPKIKQYLDRIQPYCCFISKYNLSINTSNTFPHSSGIASSASGFSAISIIIAQLEQRISSLIENDKLLKASFISRLGSGSGCRSVYGPMAIWGNHKDIEDSSNEHAIIHDQIHPIFNKYQDTILIVDKGAKKISSTVGHQLMQNHPFSSSRFIQANNNLINIINVLKNGDLQNFIDIVENEALTLHAMMMTSSPYFILMKEGTLSIINKIWNYRSETQTPVCFTLDAGANIHLLYPDSYKHKVLDFIEQELIVYCENQQYICDHVGNGSYIAQESYA